MYFLIILVVESLYFKIAIYYNILDKPNERSSHMESTIRGGGIVYIVAAVIVLFTNQMHWIMIAGLLIIGTISFVDDRITLPSRVRIIFHLLAVTLLFYALDLSSIFSAFGIAVLYIIIVGIINAYNFMDGINGITGLYSLVLLCSLQYVNLHIKFVETDLIWLPILASIVFLWFNFRKKAVCFAGDVGSISIAYWILFLLLKVIIVTNNYSYALFLLIYGLDTVSTIIFRLIRKENITLAHRSHFYQYLANERKIGHIYIAFGYSLTQLLLIFIVLILNPLSIIKVVLISTISFIIFIVIRFKIQGKQNLLKLPVNAG
ncbi:MAG: glycosyltransferase family 4 protein [Pedobacter sp.]|nr:MAG: glycosyltransferase family 4 protein [Pedobacter sp.]